MLKISAVYLIGNPEIPIRYQNWALVEPALVFDQIFDRNFDQIFGKTYFVTSLVSQAYRNCP